MSFRRRVVCLDTPQSQKASDPFQITSNARLPPVSATYRSNCHEMHCLPILSVLPSGRRYGIRTRSSGSAWAWNLAGWAPAANYSARDIAKPRNRGRAARAASFRPRLTDPEVSPCPANRNRVRASCLPPSPASASSSYPGRSVDRLLDHKRGGRRLAVEQLEDRRVLTAAVILDFTASTSGVDTGFNPPDTNGEWGSTTIVELINGNFAAFNKTDGTVAQRTTLDQFFTNAGIASIVANSFDPRIVFDHASQRWFAAAVDDAADANSEILVAVSNNSDPTMGWVGFAIDADPTNERWSDFPQLGVDAAGVYLATVNFDIPMTAASATTTSLYSIPKADLIGGVPTIANLTAFRDQDPAVVGFRPYPVVDFGADNGAGPSCPLSILRMTSSDAQTLPALAPRARHSAPRQSSTWRTLPLRPTPISLALSRTSTPGTAALGAGLRSREFTVGHLFHRSQWAQCDSLASDRRDHERGAANGHHFRPTLEFFYPSIAANEFGDVVIGFSGTSTTQFVSAYAAAGETVGGVTTFAAAAAPGRRDGRFSESRHGHAAAQSVGRTTATSLDPINPRSFWTTQEFVSATDVWSTNVAQIVFVEPDVFEPNDTQADGHGLGSVPFVTLTDLTIDDADDEDWFKITARRHGATRNQRLFR